MAGNQLTAGTTGSSKGPFGDRAIKQLYLIMGLAAAIAGGMTLYQWASEPVYAPVFANLSGRDATAVMDALQSMGIPNKVESSTGAVMVESSRLHEARLKLAGQGLPSGTGRGFEMLEQDQGFGTSQFIESARYNHALESELARSISQISSVESARVHIAASKQSVFMRNRAKPTASVLVNLKPGRGMSDGQVASIVHLVASSIPGMEQDDVSVLDQRGRLLTRDFADDRYALTNRQLEYQRKLEDTFAARIESILEPIVGLGGVRATVSADVDFSYSESTSEKYDPEASVVRSEQSREQRAGSPSGAGGVPGALTNQPPAAGVIGSSEAGLEGANGRSSATKQTTKNYEVGKVISHQQSATGELKRLTIAVVVDNVVDQASGDKTKVPLTQEQLDRFTNLVREAVGFNAERGDRVNVLNAAFQQPEVPRAEVIPMTEQPWFAQAVKMGSFVLIGILLIFMVVRPLIRALMPRMEDPEVANAAIAQAQMAKLAALEPPSEPQPQASVEKKPSQFEANLNAARSIVLEDPLLTANVIKNWIAEGA